MGCMVVVLPAVPEDREEKGRETEGTGDHQVPQVRHLADPFA